MRDRTQRIDTVVMMRRSLPEWLRYIESIHHRSIDMTLERVRDVLGRMALRLQPATAVISVAGTNGKGSSVVMLDAIYRAAGYRTARYTSPHLVRYNERVVIDGVAATDEALCAAFTVIEEARGEVPLTYFEFGTLAAFHLFAGAALEVVVLEVGLGGRLDAVNALDADAALITSIGIDHMAWLGRDRETIASEKAGIMRRGRAVISADPLPPAALARHAAAVGALLWQNGRDFRGTDDGAAWSFSGGGARRLRELPRPPLAGEAQLWNAAGAVALVQALQRRLPVSEACLRRGLRAAWLPGRLQRLAGPPEVVLDVAHNPDAVGVLSRFMRERRAAGKVRAVFAALADKPLEQVVGLMAPLVDAWYVAALAGAAAGRGRGAAETRAGVAALAGAAPVLGFDGPVAAFEAARADAGDEDCIVVFGSFITVGDIIRHVSAPLERDNAHTRDSSCTSPPTPQ